MPDPKPLRVAVVGGGTAGWLSALILKEGAARSKVPLELTVIESSKVPTIGVGEGTTSVFRGLLMQLGFDEFEFLRETGATIKYGIRHRDWRRLGHVYDGPIDDPHQMAQTPRGVKSSWLNQYCVASGRSVTEPHLFTYLMDRSRAPYVTEGRKSPLPVSPHHHAYHFDQALVGAYLRRKADGIRHMDALVCGAAQDETGNITSLEFDDANDLPVDFVVDCTGFRRALIGKVMGARWKSYSDKLPVNRAMPFWLDHGEGAIPAYTLAHAQGAGWMWQIPTQSRMGCGYVYSDAHLTPDQAQEEVEATLGHKIEPRNDIPIDCGRLDRAWIGNCLATGLAQSFFEPLEATSIHGTIVQMMMFTQFHLKALGGNTDAACEKYNADVARQVDDFCTFINLHYVSERNDTPFWCDVSATFISDEVGEMLARWARQSPSSSDFAVFPGNLPHMGEQLYYPVLDGLGLLSRRAAKSELAANPLLRAHARKSAVFLTKEGRRAASKAPDHGDFLQSLRQEYAS